MSNSSSYSLRRRLWITVLSTSVIFWTLAVLVIIGLSWHLTNHLMNGALREAGMLILEASSDFHERGILPERLRDMERKPPYGKPPGERTRSARDREFRALSRQLQYQIVVDGAIISKTPSAPDKPFIDSFNEIRGFTKTYIDGREWRIFIVKNRSENFEVQVGRPLAPYARYVQSISTRMLLPAIVLLLILGAVSWWLTSRMIAPLNETAKKIAEKSPQDLSPIVIDKMPSELTPLIDSLNNVLKRLEHALEAERRFTADAAHELRTPLAALGMKAQLLARQSPELAPALSALSADISRSTTLIEQLLLLARLDPLSTSDSGVMLRKTVPLHALVEKQCAQHETAAEKRNISLEIDISPHLTIEANPDLIAIALRNLIDNALAYIHDGCLIRISATEDERSIHLCVADNGPGVPDDAYPKLADRFFRVLGSGKPGSGLGLSIVQRIAELHQGTLAFDSGIDGEGFAAILDLPKPLANKSDAVR